MTKSREARRDKPGVPQSSSLNGWVDSVAVNWNEKQEAGWNLSDNEELRDWVSSQLFHQPRVWSWIQCLGHFSFLNYKLKRLENFTAGSFLPWIVCDLRDIMWMRQVWQSLNVKNMKLSRMWLRTLNELQTKGWTFPLILLHREELSWRKGHVSLERVWYSLPGSILPRSHSLLSL